MKIRTGFVSNSSSSSFIIHHYEEFDELNRYEITISSESFNSEEELEIFHAIAEEFGNLPNQNEEFDILHSKIPKTWEKYQYKMEKYLTMKIPLGISFSDILDIIKRYEAKENED